MVNTFSDSFTYGLVWLGASIGFGFLSFATMNVVNGLRDYLSFWKNETRKMQEVGYLAPKPRTVEATVTRLAFKLKGFIECCKITIVNRENIPSGRLIIAGNHIDIGDTDVISEIVGRTPGRFLIALSELPTDRPEGVLMAMAGAIPVDQHSKKAKLTVIDTAANALVADGQNALLAIFPQGQLDPNEEIKLESFKRGTVEIARRATMQLAPDEDLWIVPLGIHYKSDAKRVPLLNRILKREMNKFLPIRHDGTPFFTENKYEAIGVIGEPLLVGKQGNYSDLPDDNTAATKLIHTAIKDAHSAAVAHQAEVISRAERIRRTTLD